jgi:hypothetical protein
LVLLILFLLGGQVEEFDREGRIRRTSEDIGAGSIFTAIENI